MSSASPERREELIAAAREAAKTAYAPYSGFAVGAALRFADGDIVTGANVENASYGLSLCAEAAALARAMGEGRRGRLMEVAVIGSGAGVTTPCGRCRQMLHELADLGGTDPLIWCCGPGEVREMHLSNLLPNPFGPRNLRQDRV